MCSVRQPQDRKLGGLRSASTLRNQQIVRGTTRRRLVDPNIVSWNPGSRGTDEQTTKIGPTGLTAPSTAQATISHTIGVATLVALRAQLAKRHENPWQNGDGGAVRSTNQVEASDWLIRLLAHQKRAVKPPMRTIKRRVFLPGFQQNWKVRVGVFPKRKKVALRLLGAR